MSEKKAKEQRKAANKAAPARSLRKDLMVVLQNFFDEEKGNRVTSNNIDGLMGKVLRAIEPYEPKDEEAKGT